MSNLTITLFSDFLLAKAFKIFSKAYNASPLYPIRFPTFFPCSETYKHLSLISIVYVVSLASFSINSFKNLSISCFASSSSCSVVSISNSSGFLASFSFNSTFTIFGANISKKLFLFSSNTLISTNSFGNPISFKPFQ